MPTDSRLRRKQSRGWRLASTLGVAFCMLLASCAVTGRPHQPRNDEEAFVAQTVIGMADALSAGDIDRLMAKVSTGFYRGYTTMENRLRKGRSIMAVYSVTTSINDIELSDGKVVVRLHWQARWTTADSPAEGQRSGDNTLVFMRGMGIKLIDQAEDTLFGI
jgi:hypothetical protein